MQGTQKVAQKFTINGVLLSLIVFASSVIFMALTSWALIPATKNRNIIMKNVFIVHLFLVSQFYHGATKGIKDARRYLYVLLRVLSASVVIKFFRSKVSRELY